MAPGLMTPGWMAPGWMAPAFLGFVAVVAGLLVLGMLRWLPGRQRPWAVAGLLAWLAYAVALGATGVLADPLRRPPGALLLMGPVALYAVFAAFSGGVGRAALAVPLAVLVGVQAFRVGVELFLHQLWQQGFVPRMLSWEGANLDILTGLSAPVVAWLLLRGRLGLRGAMAWNLAGLALLANVVVRSVLTSPGPLNLLASEVPNRLVQSFPYSLVAGFLAPLALVLHVLAIRAIRARLRGGEGLQERACS